MQNPFFQKRGSIEGACYGICWSCYEMYNKQTLKSYFIGKLSCLAVNGFIIFSVKSFFTASSLEYLKNWCTLQHVPASCSTKITINSVPNIRRFVKWLDKQFPAKLPWYSQIEQLPYWCTVSVTYKVTSIDFARTKAILILTLRNGWQLKPLLTGVKWRHTILYTWSNDSCYNFIYWLFCMTQNSSSV